MMAHELAHVKNRDTLTMTITATIAGAISMLANFAFFFGGNRNNTARHRRRAPRRDHRAARRDADPDGDQPHARIFRRPRRRRDRRQSAVARLGARQDLQRAAGRVPMMTRRAQSGDRAALHRQPADRRAHGQSLLDASGDREPHRRAAGDGAARAAFGGAVTTRPRGRRVRAAAGPTPWSRAGARQARPLGVSSRRRARPKGAQRRRRRTSPPGLAVRRTATAILRQVIERGVPLDALLDEAHGDPHFRALDQRDRALVRAIVGVGAPPPRRDRGGARRALDRPLPDNAERARRASCTSPRRRSSSSTCPTMPPSTSPSTQAAGDRRTGRARGLVNGVLRRLARERDEILARPDAARLNTPDWLFERWSAAYGEATARARSPRRISSSRASTSR